MSSSVPVRPRAGARRSERPRSQASPARRHRLRPLAALSIVLSGLLALGGVAAAAPESDGPAIDDAPPSLEAADLPDGAPAFTEAPVDPAPEFADQGPTGPLDGVLVSEVANGGPNGGAPMQFIELANFGEEPEDISGWYVWRCGQSGGGYGPQLVVPEGTVVQPGEQYTMVLESGRLVHEDWVDATYSAGLHTWGYGVWLLDTEERIRDRVGFYHESIHSFCGNPGGFDTVNSAISWHHGQTHQRVDTTGDVSRDWIVGERTPGAPNTTEPAPFVADREEVGDVLVTEWTPAGRDSWADEFIELTNTGDTPADISGWKVWRCTTSTQFSAQTNGLPQGTVLEPGQTFVLAPATGPEDVAADFRYPASAGMHYLYVGVALLTPDDHYVDRVSFYHNRTSPCTDGDSRPMDINPVLGESYHRVSDTGDNSADFAPGRRTPGEWTAPGDLEPVEVAESAHASDLWITEIAGAGPAGNHDEFIEVTNLGTEPVDTTGWALHRCENWGMQSPDRVVLDGLLEPGESYLATAENGALRSEADGVYPGVLNPNGYGAVLYDGEGARVDGVLVHDDPMVDHCGQGLSLQNGIRADEGLTYQRAVLGGEDSYHEFVQAERSPGAYVAHEWRDQSEPLPGQLDPVSVDRAYRPSTPIVDDPGAEETGEGGFRTAVRTDHLGGADLEVGFRSATAVTIDEEATAVWAGTTAEVPPASREIEGEERLGPGDALVSEGGSGAYPFQRFEITAEEVPEEGLEIVWTGQSHDRNEIQLYGWDLTEQAWLLLDAAEPSHDGDLTLVGRVPAAMVDGETVTVLVLDGPRTSGGLFNEVGITDQSFVQPGGYDLAINHMTDTQYLAQWFVPVFTDMASWVVANQEARDIAYSIHTGDIIENWMRGWQVHNEERARREFRDAAEIIGVLNEHGVPNGVLPGNHDNYWGRTNDLYNEYFGPEMFEDQPWWGNSWQEGDNSAHYDWFVHEDGTRFLALSLPFGPSDAQIEWAAAVVEANPEWNVMLAMHSYLHPEGYVEDFDRNHHASRGRHVWEQVIVPNDNVFLVLNGHYHGVAANYADPVTGERVSVTELPGETTVFDNVGENGRRVVEMLANYQDFMSTQPEVRGDYRDRDTGFQRLLQLDLDAGLMAVNTYSPTLDEFESWRYDDGNHRGENARYGPQDDEFVVQLDLTRPTSFATQAWTVQGRASEEAVIPVAAGEVAEHHWVAEDAGLAWYAVVSTSEEIEEEAAEAGERAPEGAMLQPLLAQQSVPAAEDPAVEEPAQGATEAGAAPRVLNEPAPVTGASVVTFPRLLGTDSEPGDPTDPGVPGDPADPPTDPGQPDPPEQPGPDPEDPGADPGPGPGGGPGGDDTPEDPAGDVVEEPRGAAEGPEQVVGGERAGTSQDDALGATGVQVTALIAVALLMLAAGLLLAARRRVR